ncbi:MAG: LamG-like jellyroll fold domain-containing protein, partial [bacterium]|nr:LamG-like jellyroll fold domain-containing protein [bacterium]
SDPYIFKYKNLSSKDNFYLLVHSSNVLNFIMYDDSYGWTQAAQLNSGQYDVPTNKEIMVSATWSQADMSVRFYLNGEQISRREYDSSFPLIASGTENIEIGHSSVVVDEIRILDKVLSVDEIKENYKRSAPFSKNDILYSGDFSSGNSVSISLTTSLGQITDSATVSGNKISITSPDGYFVEHSILALINLQFNTPSSMTCRYGAEPNLYDQLPYSAGTGTSHSINLSVADPIEPVPVAIKCRDSLGQSDDYGFFRQYRILPELTIKYPKISRIWWGNNPQESEVSYLSKFDMVSFSKSAIIEPDVVRQIRQANPNEVVLLYQSAVGLQNYTSVPFRTLYDRINDNMRLQSSETATNYCLNYFFPQNIIYNVYSNAYTQAVAEHMEKDIFDRYHLFDGIWWDVTGPSLWFLRNPSTSLYATWCDFNLDGTDEDLNNNQTLLAAQNFWSQGIHNEMLATRQKLGQKVLTIGNGHSPNQSDYNGKLWEETFDYSTFSNYFNPSYQDGFFYWQEHSLTPRLNDNLFANNNLEGSLSFYKYHRFGMASSLIAGIYYNPQVLNQDKNWWWFDEYWVNPLTALPTIDRALGAGYLGQPVGPAYIDSNLVWRRDFRNGIVLVNNTAVSKTVNLFGQYREINGTQDHTINGGRTVESLQLAAYDGRVLLRSLCQSNPYQDVWCIGDVLPIIDIPRYQ